MKHNIYILYIVYILYVVLTNFLFAYAVHSFSKFLNSYNYCFSFFFLIN